MYTEFQQELAACLKLDLSKFSDQARFEALDCSDYPNLLLDGQKERFFEMMKAQGPINLKTGCYLGQIPGYLVYALSANDYLTFNFYVGYVVPKDKFNYQAAKTYTEIRLSHRKFEEFCADTNTVLMI